MHKHKKELTIASSLLIMLGVGAVLFYTFQPFRILVSDAYYAVFKIVISDRVLKEKSAVYSGITYCQSKTDHQSLDLFLPDDTSKPVPLVVFIHGGGWRSGDKANKEVSYYGETLLERDIAVASINYRDAPDYTYPSQNQDVSCALSFLQTNASKYHLDTKRWGLFGDSAGAQLGALAMSDKSVNAPLRAFVGFYGPYDLNLQIARTPRRDRDAYIYTNNGADAIAASPMYMDANQAAHYLLFHGDGDRVVPIAQSQQYAQKLRAEGVSVEFVTVANADHYFSPRSKPNAKDIRSQVTRFFAEQLQ